MILPNKKVHSCRLGGVDGNAFFLMAHWSGHARREGWTREEIDAVLAEARGGDYMHLVGTLADHCADPFGESDDE